MLKLDSVKYIEATNNYSDKIPKDIYNENVNKYFNWVDNHSKIINKKFGMNSKAFFLGMLKCKEYLFFIALGNKINTRLIELETEQAKVIKGLDFEEQPFAKQILEPIRESVTAISLAIKYSSGVSNNYAGNREKLISSKKLIKDMTKNYLLNLKHNQFFGLISLEDLEKNWENKADEDGVTCNFNHQFKCYKNEMNKRIQLSNDFINDNNYNR